MISQLLLISLLITDPEFERVLADLTINRDRVEMFRRELSSNNQLNESRRDFFERMVENIRTESEGIINSYVYRLKMAIQQSRLPAIPQRVPTTSRSEPPGPRFISNPSTATETFSSPPFSAENVNSLIDQNTYSNSNLSAFDTLNTVSEYVSTEMRRLNSRAEQIIELMRQLELNEQEN